MAAIPLIVFYFVSFYKLHIPYRALVPVACVVIMVSGIAVLVPVLGQVRRWRARLGVAIVIATILFSYGSGVVPPSHAESAFPGLFELGGSVMVGLAAAVLIFTMLLQVPERSRPGVTMWGDSLSVLRSQLPLLIVLTCTLLAIVYWSQIQTTRVYYWDYLVYWRKTDQLYQLLSTGMFSAAAKLAIAQYAHDYTMLPAILPALISFAAGSADRINYVLGITVVYAVPAYLLVHALGRRLAGAREGSFQLRGYADLLSILTLLIAFPLFLDRVLDLMPDIGGVALVVLTLFLAHDIIVLLAAPAAPAAPAAARLSGPELVRLTRLSLALGGLLCMMAFFRRWYVFAAVGVCAASLLLICWEFVTNRAARQRMRRNVHIPVILIGASSLTFISWLLIDWSAKPTQHSYADLYASYAYDLRINLSQFFVAFGFIPPALALLAVLWSWVAAPERRLLLLLLISTAVSCGLFMLVQSPSQHHYYLLMPLFGAGIVVLSLRIQLRWGAGPAIAIIALLLLGGASVSRVNALFSADRLPFHDLRSWLPDKQPGGEGLVTIAQWLMSEENRSQKFCLIASGSKINQSIMREVWQIAPQIPLSAFHDRMVMLGEVDSRDGPPGAGFNRCEIALVAWPPQIHLPKGRQYNVELPATDLMESMGIGAAFHRLPETFDLFPGVKVYVFRKDREPTEAEYSELVQRFHDARVEPQ